MSRGIRRRWGVPDKVMIPVAARMQRTLGKTIENFTTYEIQTLKSGLGHEYAHIPDDDIRMQATNCRKQGKLGSVKGHGPSKYEPELSDEYKEYLCSPHWKEFAENVREFWDYRCAFCNSDKARDVHHRTYERLRNERLTDCILLCRLCHKVADQRRKREKSKNTQATFA